MALIDDLTVAEWQATDLDHRADLLQGLTKINGTAGRMMTFGRILLSVRRQLKYGAWGKWLKVNCRICERYVNYLMNLAELWDQLSPEDQSGPVSRALDKLGIRKSAKNSPELIHTVCYGDNSDLIASAGKLYIKDAFRVADVTYGGGVFWKKTDCTRFELLKSDLLGHGDITTADFRCLPYEDACLDVVVLDPPYTHTSGHLTRDTYNNNLNRNKSHAQVIDLYSEGISEARRVLRRNGFLFLKCKDEMDSGIQRWSHIELYTAALALGFIAKDLFILIPSNIGPDRWLWQQHAKKNHSYLWIFQKKPQGVLLAASHASNARNRTSAVTA